jgi:hypothetical protein
MPVLVQSEPEGADIYVSGKLESVGTTPKWINLEMDRLNPARVMFRKSGYQDKAIAIETDRPPVAQLIPTNAVGRTGGDLASGDAIESARRHAAAAAAARRKKAAEEEP